VDQRVGLSDEPLGVSRGCTVAMPKVLNMMRRQHALG
jgi:hypothetical protein